MTDSLGSKGSLFYSKIVYSGSVGDDDKTYLHSKNIENSDYTSSAW
jgi:hypothetical protein